MPLDHKAFKALPVLEKWGQPVRRANREPLVLSGSLASKVKQAQSAPRVLRAISVLLGPPGLLVRPV